MCISLRSRPGFLSGAERGRDLLSAGLDLLRRRVLRSGSGLFASWPVHNALPARQVRVFHHPRELGRTHVLREWHRLLQWKLLSVRDGLRERTMQSRVSCEQHAVHHRVECPNLLRYRSGVLQRGVLPVEFLL